MSQEFELSIGLKGQLERWGIPVAHSLDEARMLPIDLDNRSDIIRTARHISTILTIWKGENSWNQLKNMNILDLASGSVYSVGLLKDWLPHFARLCSVNGAKVFALDIEPQSRLDGSLFEWAEEDIVQAVMEKQLKNLESIKGRRFNLLNSTNFVGNNPAPGLLECLSGSGINKNEFEEELLRQSGEIIVEGGAVSLDRSKNYLYVKTNGKLVRVEHPDLPCI